MATMATTYPTLYKKGTNNKILEWTLHIVPNTTFYDIATTYGEKGGNLIEKRATIMEGKAGRTVLQQATQEATRRFKDKKEKENYRETIDENDTTIEMRPMLAQTFSPELYQPKTTSRSFKLEFPLYVQPKLDGIRCISHFVPGSHEIKMISRKGTPISFEHIQEPLFMQLNTTTAIEEIFIDGELYSTELTFEKISGIVRKQSREEQDEKTIKKIQYHIYDIYIPNSPHLGYTDRYRILCSLFPHTNTNPFYKLVHTEYADSFKMVMPLHQKYVEEGYEGIMLRDKNGPYEIDKRSKYLQKYKTFLEEEFEIVGFGEEDGMIIFQCKTGDNRIFMARPRGTFEKRAEMFINGPTYIGKHLTVIFQEYTELGVPRFPVGKCVRDYE